MPLTAITPQRAKVVQRVQVTKDSGGRIISKTPIGAPIRVPAPIVGKSTSAGVPALANRVLQKSVPVQPRPGAIVSRNILSNKLPVPKNKIPMGDQVEAVPINKPFYAQGDFSYAQPGPVRIWKQDMIIPDLEEPAAQAEGQFSQKTAGEELVDSMSGRLYETTAGLVVMEEPDQYAEEASMLDSRPQDDQRRDELGNGDPFSHNSESIAKWMQDNDRSSAGTTLMGDDMNEYGGDMGMKGFGMEGLGSYASYQAANKSTFVLMGDVVLAANRASNSWKNLERLTRDSVMSELSKMGYPASEIASSIDGIIAIIPGSAGDKIRQRFYAKYRATTETGGSQTAAPPSTGAKSTASAGLPVWAIPVAAIGALLLFKKLKS